MRRKNPQKTFEKNAAVLAALGIDVSSVADVSVDKTYRRNPNSDTLDLIGCIVYLDTGGANFIKQLCSECKQLYAVEWMYRSRGMLCSDECRAANLEKRGLFWDSRKTPQERWKRKLPVIVPPAALPLVEEILREQPKSEAPQPTETPLQPPTVDSSSVASSFDSVDDFELDLTEFGIE